MREPMADLIRVLIKIDMRQIAVPAHRTTDSVNSIA